MSRSHGTTNPTKRVCTPAERVTALAWAREYESATWDRRESSEQAGVDRVYTPLVPWETRVQCPPAAYPQRHRHRHWTLRDPNPDLSRTYRWPRVRLSKCLDFVNTKLMCHITLEGSDVTSASAVKFIRHKFDKAKGRDLTVRSIRMSEDNDPIPTKDGFADLSKFRWMRQYMPGLGRYRGHWVRLSRSTTDTRFAEAVNYAPPGWTSGHYTECEERHDYAKHGL